jgi:hypothetical protein
VQGSWLTAAFALAAAQAADAAEQLFEKPDFSSCGRFMKLAQAA